VKGKGSALLEERCVLFHAGEGAVTTNTASPGDCQPQLACRSLCSEYRLQERAKLAVTLAGRQHYSAVTRTLERGRSILLRSCHLLTLKAVSFGSPCSHTERCP